MRTKLCQEAEIPSDSEPSLDADASPMKVCLASPFFHPEYSGGATRFRRYAPGLRARGIHMEVVAAALGTWNPDRRFARGSGTARDTPEQEIDRFVHRVDVLGKGGVWKKSAIGRQIFRVRKRWRFESAILRRCRDPLTRPDLVIWRCSLSLTSLRALRAIHRLGIPMMRVVTMYGGPGGTGINKRIREWSFPIPFEYLDCVVVSSEAMRRNLRSLGVTTRIEVIAHGVDLDRFQPHPDGPSGAPVRERLGLTPDDKLVLFVGPLSKRKGVDILAQAWPRVASEHPRAHLVLVGPERSGSPTPSHSEDSFSEGVRAALASGEGSERVRFVGPVANVEEFMRGADIFVFPSRREGMPNVVLEAFSSGVACLMTPFDGLSEDLGFPGAQFVLVEHDAHGFSREMARLLADDAARTALGRAAREWARERMGLEQSLDRLSSLCGELGGRAVLPRGS